MKDKKARSLKEINDIINNHKKVKKYRIKGIFLNLVGLMLPLILFLCTIILYEIIYEIIFLQIFLYILSFSISAIGLLKSIIDLSRENKQYKRALRQLENVKRRIKRKGTRIENLKNFKFIKTFGEIKTNVYAMPWGSDGRRMVIEESHPQIPELNLSNGTPVFIDADEYDYKVSYCSKEDLDKSPVLNRGVRK